MFIEIIRIVYGMWAVTSFLFFLNAISVILFMEDAWRAKLRYFMLTIWFCLIWPIAIFSPDGRKVLSGKFHKL